MFSFYRQLNVGSLSPSSPILYVFLQCILIVTVCFGQINDDDDDDLVMVTSYVALLLRT